VEQSDSFAADRLHVPPMTNVKSTAQRPSVLFAFCNKWTHRTNLYGIQTRFGDAYHRLRVFYLWMIGILTDPIHCVSKKSPTLSLSISSPNI